MIPTSDTPQKIPLGIIVEVTSGQREHWERLYVALETHWDPCLGIATDGTTITFWCSSGVLMPFAAWIKARAHPSIYPYVRFGLKMNRLETGLDNAAVWRELVDEINLFANSEWKDRGLILDFERPVGADKNRVRDNARAASFDAWRVSNWFAAMHPELELGVYPMTTGSAQDWEQRHYAMFGLAAWLGHPNMYILDGTWGNPAPRSEKQNLMFDRLESVIPLLTEPMLYVRKNGEPATREDRGMYEAKDIRAACERAILSIGGYTQEVAQLHIGQDVFLEGSLAYEIEAGLKAKYPPEPKDQ